MKLTKLQSNLIVLLFLITIVIVAYLRGQRQKETIQKNIQQVSGTITETSMAHRGAGLDVTYQFSFENKIIENQHVLSVNSGIQNFFLGKTFPVVFSKDHPEANEMLILPKDFARFNLPYPDSLKWVINLIEKK